MTVPLSMSCAGWLKTAYFAIERNKTPYLTTPDLLGNIASLSDLDGNIVESYRYTAFGETEILNPNGSILTHSHIHNLWQYATKRLDPETGYYAFGLCYYDPSQGR